MDLWISIKQRYLFLSIFIIIMLASLVLLVSIWQNRSTLPKTLTIVTIVIGLFLILLSLFSLIYILSFGYNA